MTPPATGETTPLTKRQRPNPTTAPVTPCDVVTTLTIALQAATDAAAANAAVATEGMDTEEDT